MPILELKDLSIGYKKTLISNINLTTGKSEVVALIGLNGAGKSTLLKTISKIIRPISGNVFLYKKSIEKFSASVFAKKIGFSSFGNVFNANMTVRELVGLGRIPHTSILGKLEAEDQKAIDNAIVSCDLKDIENKNISKISDGQRQRAFIARLIAQQTDILIFDEPTAFLDIEGKYKIVKLFRNISQKMNKIIIFSTHDLKIAIQNADKIWLFYKNQIIEGAPEDLILQNYFTKLFSEAKINFNNFTADFDVVNNVSKNVRLNNESTELTKIWTQNCLRKIGYSIDDKSDIEISILSDHWEIKISNKRYKANTLAEMIKILKNYEKN